jgi:hypothetical protein
MEKDAGCRDVPHIFLTKSSQFLPNLFWLGISQGQFHAGLEFEWCSLTHNIQICTTPPFPIILILYIKDLQYLKLKAMGFKQKPQNKNKIPR